jgi:hypothetical protein
LNPVLTTSGLMRPSLVGPMELKYDTRLLSNALSSMSLAASIEPTQREFFDIHGDKAVEVPLAPNATIRTQHDKK